MFKTVWQNLTRAQKIGLVVLIQTIFIITIISVATFFLQDKDHIVVSDNDNQLKSVPAEEIQLYEKALWEIISNNVDNVDESVIKDAVVREDSYIEEIDEENHTVNASFLVDIDSIQQTYVVNLAWISKPTIEPITPIIDCPTVENNKYPNSYCKGTYRDTNDLSIYLPYTIPAEHDENVWDVQITEDEESKKINVYIENCRPDELKKKAQEYLNSIPADLSNYIIEYYIEEPDGGYFGNLNKTEIQALNERCGW